MLMIIVGAGASYGCRPSWAEDNRRPPLAADLFSPDFGDLLSGYGAARGLVQKLRRKLHGDNPEPLEELLADLAAPESDSPGRRRELLALRMYIQNLMLEVTDSVRSTQGGVTLYDELVSTVSEWSHRTGAGVLYVSLNYDLLLDDAVRDQHGLHLQYMEDYIEGEVKLIKPHGSADWRERTELQGKHRNDAIAVAHELSPTGDVTLARRSVPVFLASNDVPFIPRLALPIMGKTDTVAPREHIEAIRALQGTVTGVVTIGWRGREPHLLPVMKEALSDDVRVTVVDADDHSGGVVASHLREAWQLPAAPRWLSDGFAGLLEPDNGSSELDYVLRDLDHHHMASS